MDKVSMRKNKNRRGYFRIYDEVNFSYKKIDQTWASYPNLIADNREPSFSTDIAKVRQDLTSLLPKLEKDLPDLAFNEYESRNVNISAGGMAFNCNDALREGDILAIKIRLPSSMTVIVTYSQVVYCKDIQADGSPNDSPHPRFIGTHFVDMKEEDRKLLVKHVDKKRGLQHWVNGAILAAVITLIAIPDVVFGLLVEFLHFLLELILHILHLSFEFIEMNLDHVIEHLFHTDLHQTQVIVFYVILTFIVYGLYLLVRTVPSFCRRCKQNLLAAYAFKKASLAFFWREQSLLDKTKIVAIVVAAAAAYFFLGM
jgi:hypothetical protein